MKKLHRILIVAACVLLVASMASPAFAVSQVLYRGTQDGYACVGSVNISSDKVSAAFSAVSMNDLAVSVPVETCSSKVSIVFYDEREIPLLTVTGNNGCLQAGAVYERKSSDTYTYAKIYYYFNGATHGPYEVSL